MNRRSFKNTKVRVPILNTEYKVIVCWGTQEFVAKVFRLYHYPDKKILLEGDRGRTFWRTGCFPIIVLSVPPTTTEMIGTLAHESVHAVGFILDSLDEGRTREIFAHSVGAIVRETLNVSYRKFPLDR